MSTTFINSPSRLSGGPTLANIKSQGNLTQQKSRAPEVSNKVKERIELSLRRLLEASISRRRKKFYSSPKLRQFWGDDQEELESWGELFFDLIYVGMAFKLGDIIKDAVENEEQEQISFYFFGQFCPMYSVWYARTNVLSQFSEDSYFHTAMVIITSLMAALMALFIGTQDQIREGVGQNDLAVESDGSHRLLAETAIVSINYNTLLGFAMCYFVLQFLGLARCVEMRLVTAYHGIKDDLEPALYKREQAAVINASRVYAIRQLIALLFGGIAVIFAYEGMIGPTMTALFSAFLSSMLFYVLRRGCTGGCWVRRETIPINVDFVLKRIGEFTMLMLGEGILQIIIKVINEDHLAQHIGLYSLSFLILALTHFIAFYLVPYEAEEHAFRKSGTGALILNFLYPLSSGSLIFIGVALKLVLQEQEIIGGEEGRKFTNLLVFSMALSTFIFIAESLTCTGFYEIFRLNHSFEHMHDDSWKNFNFPRVSFSFFYLISPVLFLIASLLQPKPIGLLLMVLGIQAVIIMIGRLEKFLFHKSEAEEKENISKIVSQDMVSMSLDFPASFFNVDGSEMNEAETNVKHMLTSIRQRTHMVARDLRLLKEACTSGFDFSDQNTSSLMTNIDILQGMTTMLQDTLHRTFDREAHMENLLSQHLEAQNTMPENHMEEVVITADPDNATIENDFSRRAVSRQSGTSLSEI